MIRGMFAAATGMVAQQSNIDAIANNLANVNTTGFKRSRVSFQDLLYETIRPPGTQSSDGSTTPEGIQIGHGVRLSSVAKVFSSGSFIRTEGEFDMAIEGDGFFSVTLPDGREAYTRDGSFRANADGDIVTVDGFFLTDGISVPIERESVAISTDGTISVKVANQPEATIAGQIQLVRFPNPAGLDATLGQGLLLESAASGAPLTGTPGEDGTGFIRHKFLENSNVQVVEEIINLIIAQRAYEANSKVIQTSDEMLQVANNVRR